MKLASRHLVVMGVSGCGKSTLAAALSAALDVDLIEGDDHHTQESRAKMERGIPLVDADRAGWLQALGELMSARQHGAVVSCSALKRRYRDQLREAVPELRFVFMDLPYQDALLRVEQRGQTHFFSPRLVRTQFDALERPDGESSVLCLDARDAVPELIERVVSWVKSEGGLSASGTVPPLS